MNTIKIERNQNQQSINGQPATEREITVLANKIHANPQRYVEVRSDSLRGFWIYEDRQEPGT